MVNPVGPKERERLNAILKRLEEWVAYAHKCKACGLNMEEREAAAAFLYDQTQKFLTEFVGVKKERATSGQRLVDQAANPVG